jgi:hypothetical protein
MGDNLHGEVPVKKYTGSGAPPLPDRDAHNLFIENAERLRHCAVYGDHDHMAKVLKNRANPCGADEFGLTPLMIAAWNGHTECVKFLIANPLGISIEKEKRSCVNMQTIKGLTAMHIFCQEALPWADEILFWLLLGDADVHALDQDGKSPLDYARENARDNFVEQMEQWEAIKGGRATDEDAVLKRKTALARDELERLYAYHYDPLVMVSAELQANFPVPKFIFEEQRVGSMPKGMKIHEHQIKPLTDAGFDTMDDLVDSLHCLDFSKGQADVNMRRREALVKLQDGDWKAPDKPKMLAKRTKNRRKEGEVKIQETREERQKREAEEKAVKDKARAEREAKLMEENRVREEAEKKERIRLAEKAKRAKK